MSVSGESRADRMTKRMMTVTMMTTMMLVTMMMMVMMMIHKLRLLFRRQQTKSKSKSKVKSDDADDDDDTQASTLFPTSTDEVEGERLSNVWGWPVMRRRRCQSGHPQVGRA